jgi:1-hydroxycarotenoid 3,4-desaturase
MTSPNRQPRVVVIGAGMGGLSAALDLARQGCDVTVLERAATPGGKMREVNVGGANIDAGPTVFTMRWMFESLFADAGASISDYLDLQSATVLARHAWTGGGRLDLFADMEASVAAIGEFAGARDAAGYREFCARSRDIYQTLRVPYIASQRPSPIDLVRRVGITNLGALWRTQPLDTLWRALGKYFHDPRLRQLFGRYATYVGSSPALAPATLMLIAHVEQDGVWLVKGGMRRVADAFVALGMKHGARYQYESHVAEIMTKDGRVSGVRVQHKDGREDVINCDAVVFNGDISAMATGLLGEPAKRAAKVTTPALRSLSAVTWNVLAKTSAEQSNNQFIPHHHNVFFADDYLAEFDAIFRRRAIVDTPTVYVCAQDRPFSNEKSSPSAERLLILVNAPADGDRTSFSARQIDELTDKTFALMRGCGFDVVPENASSSIITTPEKFASLFPASGGALYGRANHGSMASFARPGAKTKIGGLYLAGGTAHPGPGVPMATLSGRLAAAQLMQDF